MLPSIIAGVTDHPVEDVKISDIYLEQVGGGGPELAAIKPEEKADAYPEPTMFGQLPATGFYMRHARNVELTNVEIATMTPDARPAFYLEDVEGADFFRLRMPRASGEIVLKNVADFRVFGCAHYPDAKVDRAEDKTV